MTSPVLVRASRAWFTRRVIDHGRGPRWTVPVHTAHGWMHIHRPVDGESGVWLSDSERLTTGDPGRRVLVSDDPLALLAAGPAVALLERVPGGEMRRMRWVAGPGGTPGRIVLDNVPPHATPALGPCGEVLSCLHHDDAVRRRVVVTTWTDSRRAALLCHDSRGSQLVALDGDDVLLEVRRPERIVVAGSHLLIVGVDAVRDPSGQAQWGLPEGTMLGVIALTDSAGTPSQVPDLVAVTRHEGLTHVRPLCYDSSPGVPLWSSPLGATVVGAGAGPGGDLWLVVAEAGRPGSLIRVRSSRHDDATTTDPLLTHRRMYATSRDGTQIPYIVTRAADDATSRPRPALLTVYGGFAVEHWPEPEPTVPAWVDAGGIVVTAQVRGGGELGVAWHDAGRGENKRRSADDLLDIAHDLVERDMARPGGIVLCGASHGGLVATLAALTDDMRQPVLGGVAVTAPLLDVTDLERHGNGRFWTDEFPTGIEARRQVSPLWRITQSHAPLPPLWVASMGEDTRVADDAARFAGQWAQRGTVRHRREEGVGHVGAPIDMLDDRAGDLLAFAWAATTGRSNPPQKP